MKFTWFLIIGLLHGCRGLQDQFKELDNLKEVQSLEAAIEDFGKKKQTIMDRIKQWQSGAAKSKVDQIEQSIKGFFEPRGELRNAVISRELKKRAAAGLDPDFTMPITRSSLFDIRLAFAPLKRFQDFYQAFKTQQSETEKKLIYNSELNKKVYELVTEMRRNQFKLKKALLTFFTNIQAHKDPKFDLRQFFFADAFEAEDRFVNKRANRDVNELYLIYQDQKRRFIEQQHILSDDYGKLNDFLNQFYEKVAALQQFYEKQRRAATIMDFDDPTVEEGVGRLIDLRRQIAEICQLVHKELELIKNQRNVFERIYTLAHRMDGVTLQKRIQDSAVSGGPSSADIMQEAADQQEAEVDLEEEREDEAETQSDLQEAENLKRELNLTRASIKGELAKRLSLDDQEKDIDAELKAKAAARDKREQERKKRAQLREQRARERAQNSEQALQKKLALQKINSGTSPEAHFRDKEYSDQIDTYSRGIQERIDDGELKLSDVDSVVVSEHIVQNDLDKSKQNPDSNILAFGHARRLSDHRPQLLL